MVRLTKGYNICNSKRVLIIMNLLECEGLTFKQTLTDDEQEICKK